MPIDYDSARGDLLAAFGAAEEALLSGGAAGNLPQRFSDVADAVFASRTQAFREVLLGCVLARIQDKGIDIRLPYVSQGDSAYNGRTLDERVVNPMLQEKRVPSSRGPFLSVFRRMVSFVPATRDGLRDKTAYDAFLAMVGFVEEIDDDEGLRAILEALAFRFVELREASDVPLTRVQRMSLEQVVELTARLLDTPSGGRLPVYAVVAMFQAINRRFQLGWDIQWQGINVADTASGVGGDISVMSGDSAILVAEVTERAVDRNRIVATFNSKVGPHGIREYIYFVGDRSQPEEAVQQARRYFAQGHEINFVVVIDWIAAGLATLGSEGRSHYTEALLDLMGQDDTPAALRAIWNDNVSAIISG